MIRDKIFSLGTIYALILTVSIYFSVTGNYERKSDKLLLYEKAGIVFKVGSDKPYSGSVKDTVRNKIIEYYLIDGKKYGDFKVSNLDGIVEISGVMNDNKNEGIWNYFYPNGQLESRGTFYNDEPNGTWNWYYPNGRLKVKGYYENSKKVGTWQFYNNQSRLVKEISYKDDNIQLVRNYELKIST